MDSEALYFVKGLVGRGEDPDEVEFLDVGEDLGVNVSNGSFVVTRDEVSLYVVSSGVVYLLECERDDQL